MRLGRDQLLDLRDPHFLRARAQRDHDLEVGALDPSTRIDQHPLVVELDVLGARGVLEGDRVHDLDQIAHTVGERARDRLDAHLRLRDQLRDARGSRAERPGVDALAALREVTNARRTLLPRRKPVQPLHRRGADRDRGHRHQRLARRAFGPHQTVRSTDEHIVQIHPVGIDAGSGVVLDFQPIDILAHDVRLGALDVSQKIVKTQPLMPVREGQPNEAGDGDLVALLLGEHQPANAAHLAKLRGAVAVHVEQ